MLGDVNFALGSTLPPSEWSGLFGVLFVKELVGRTLAKSPLKFHNENVHGNWILLKSVNAAFVVLNA